MDVSHLSFNTLLLLEKVQLSWLPGWLPEKEVRIAFGANPVVEWYFRNKCPQTNEWLDTVMAADLDSDPSPAEIRQAEVEILSSMTDLIIYAVDPSVYDAQPFLNWDAIELLCLADFTGKTVIDVGAGTGKLTLLVAEKADVVFAVEPVTNLRNYLKLKANSRKLENLHAVDGLITDIPFPSRFADITMAGHVFGDDLEDEYRELRRVTKPGGKIILCPGNSDLDNDKHKFLVSHGFEWSRFEEPRDGVKRKYWKMIE
jgi:Methylase involved in ubiquinone/menaquinone biosynthesis